MEDNNMSLPEAIDKESFIDVVSMWNNYNGDLYSIWNTYIGEGEKMFWDLFLYVLIKHELVPHT